MFNVESLEWVKKKRGRKKLAPQARHFEMKEMYLHGKTLKEIGDLQNPPLTRERVRQLLKNHFNIIGEDGGASLRLFANKTEKLIEKKKQRQERIANKLGCTEEFFDSVNQGKTIFCKNSPSRFYLEQKRNAICNRNIDFKLTFKEWWDIWQESGKYELRGQGKGYCMTRIGDTGCYEIGNVEIKTIGQNFSESFFKHSHEDRRKKAIENKRKVKNGPR